MSLAGNISTNVFKSQDDVSQISHGTSDNKDALPPVTLSLIQPSLWTKAPWTIGQLLVNLFYRPGERTPPVTGDYKTLHARLITLASSPFGEKVRWALDLMESAEDRGSWYYTEDAHPPLFKRFHHPSQSAVVVVLPDGAYLEDSDTVVRKLCPYLYPSLIAKTVMDFEDEMAKRLGATLRCHMYGHLLGMYEEDDLDRISVNRSKYHFALLDWTTKGVPRIERILFRIGLARGRLDKPLAKLMNVTPKGIAASEKEILQLFNDMSAKLEATGSNEGYLMDAPNLNFGFTAADLAFAALAYPYIRPECMLQDWLLPEEELPPRLVEFCHKLRQTRAGQHVLRIYERHRPVDALDHQVHMKTQPELGTLRHAWWIGMIGVVGAAGVVGLIHLWMPERGIRTQRRL
jgi:hypothetical protein